MVSTPLIARSALGSAAQPGRYGAHGEGPPGVILVARTGLAIAHIASRKGKTLDVMQRLADVLGTMPEDGPRHVAGVGIALVGCGPGQWLALAEGERQLISRLTVAVAGAASMVDLTSAKAVMGIAGPRARDVLAKGCGLDLEPAEFPSGSAAAAQVDHIACQLWQIDATPAYELMVGRSLAKSFWSWLTASAAEYGYEVR